MTQGEQNDTSELPEGMPAGWDSINYTQCFECTTNYIPEGDSMCDECYSKLVHHHEFDYGYPLLPFDEGEWCECCGKAQPVKDGKCAVCGNGYDECQEDDVFDRTFGAWADIPDFSEEIRQSLNARLERLYPYLIDSE